MARNLPGEGFDMASVKWKFWGLTAARLRIVEQTKELRNMNLVGWRRMKVG